MVWASFLNCRCCTATFHSTAAEGWAAVGRILLFSPYSSLWKVSGTGYIQLTFAVFSRDFLDFLSRRYTSCTCIRYKGYLTHILLLLDFSPSLVYHWNLCLAIALCVCVCVCVCVWLVCWIIVCLTLNITCILWSLWLMPLATISLSRTVFVLGTWTLIIW